MNFNSKCLFVAAIIANLSCTAFAIFCYDCNSINNPDCDESFDSYITNCDYALPTSFNVTYPEVLNLKANSCMRIGFRKPGSDELKAIIRSCNWESLDYKIAPSLEYLYKSRLDCYSELCNSSIVTGPIAATVALFIALTRLMS